MFPHGTPRARVRTFFMVPKTGRKEAPVRETGVSRGVGDEWRGLSEGGEA